MVAPRAAVDPVATRPSVETVGARPACNRVGTAAVVELVRARSADEHVRETAADDPLDPGEAVRPFVHVSVDLDFVDPLVAPGVGSAVRSGVSYREAHLMMELVAESGLLTSLELVEVNPILARWGAPAGTRGRARLGGQTDLAASYGPPTPTRGPGEAS